MGASSAEIDRQIRETRGQLDEKLALLEKRAASGARRYGRIAAGVAAGVAAIAIGVVLYRRRRQRSVVRRLHKMLSESVPNLPAEAISRFKERLPIKVVVTDKAHEESAPSTWADIAQKVAPAVAGSATGALLARFGRTRRTPDDDSASD